MHKQTQPYGCGLYAVANALKLEGFITQERLEKSNCPEGVTIGQLSRYLQDDNLPISIEPLWYNTSAKNIPKAELLIQPQGVDVEYLPILIAVRHSHNSLNHLLAGRIDKSGILYLYDSLRDVEVKTTLKSLNSLYPIVYGLFYFKSLAEGKEIFILTND
jgi:hypothetical protein